MRFKGFIGPAYTLKSATADCQECVNLYYSPNELGTGKEGEPGYLTATPGLASIIEASGLCIGLYTTTNNRTFFVTVGTLQELLFNGSAYSTITRGTGLDITNNTVNMTDNGIELIIVTGNNGYLLNFSGNTFSTITASGFTGADTVVFQNGYFIINKKGTDKVQVSGIYNGATWDPLDVATVEGSPDNVTGLISCLNELKIFGERSLEVWSPTQNPGPQQFPFERIPGVYIEKGCISRDSVCKTETSVVFVHKDERGNGVVYMLQGYSPVPISNEHVEKLISLETDLSILKAFIYQDGKHVFYQLNLTNTSVVYDFFTQMWHERSYLNNGIRERHRAHFFTFAFGKYLVTDYVNSKIYELSNTIYKDDTNFIQRIRTSPHITSDLKRITYDSFQLDVQVGGAESTGDDSDPQIEISWSDTDGRTWKTPRIRSIGFIGEYKKRVLIRRCGTSRSRIFRVKFTGGIAINLIGVELNISENLS